MNKKSWSRFATMILSVGLVSCMGPNGPDGDDGFAFVSISDNDGFTYSYTDDNPAVPYGLTWGSDYESTPGTYNFSYESRQYISTTSYTYVVWSGYYKIWVNAGKKGGDGQIFWQEGDKGADGPDSYLDLACDYHGTVFNRLNKESLASPEIVPETFEYQYDSGRYSYKIVGKRMDMGSRNVNDVVAATPSKISR
jgi:hypothetical protein